MLSAQILNNYSNSAVWQQRNARGSGRGFTLIELMVVMAIIIILMTIAVSHYDAVVAKARETVLRSDLAVLRKAIQDYTLDKECGPSTLDDLVAEKYVGSIPNDPMTSSKDWVTVSDDVSLSPEQTCNGISDVHSASDRISPLTSSAYSSW
jgi:general secretion pathway protein G